MPGIIVSGGGGGGGAPSGAAGGSLGGTYPNPSIAAGAVGSTELASNAVTTAKITDANVTTAKLAANAVDGSKTGSRVVAISPSANTYTPNCDTTDKGTLTLAATNTIAAPTGTPVDEQRLFLRVAQDATGGRTVTWNGAYKFPYGTPVLSSAISAVDGFGFRWDATSSKWVCMGILIGMA